MDVKDSTPPESNIFNKLNVNQFEKVWSMLFKIHNFAKRHSQTKLLQIVSAIVLITVETI